jgi:hypothetical protein
MYARRADPRGRREGTAARGGFGWKEFRKEFLRLSVRQQYRAYK